ncbi:fumarylacetoacetate hydrolase family protein [uncultured Alsobacter sp.]|uniref:2-keto-4-pentenoate hydratase n=1 Tax=uncultured Alsobacter sp. TaxID=1748258 RepID=UPI0025EBB0DF|nr:fumarylacetoacetate hydrolase family protein [uncultured Alsobacter sp.]
MLTPTTMQAASDLLHATWMESGRLDRLPEASRPSTRAEGYAIQALLERRSAHPVFGWKIAATSVAGQKHIGVSGPLAGRLLRERVLPAGQPFPLRGNLMRVAEVEFAFAMARDLAPRPAPYTQEEVLAAVATLHPAIEVPDSRYADFVHAGEAQIIADNACAHLFVLGPAATAPWRDLDLAAFEVAVRHERAGKPTTLTGRGSNVLGDPRIGLTWLANELSGLGITLARGQVITTGTCLVPIDVLPGDGVSADYGPLGSIAVRFVD